MIQSLRYAKRSGVSKTVKTDRLIKERPISSPPSSSSWRPVGGGGAANTGLAPRIALLFDRSGALMKESALVWG
jgi:hypothetical protein